MKIRKMTKGAFPMADLRKWLTHVALICNHKVAISVYSRNCKN